jgi:hypothetical protein
MRPRVAGLATCDKHRVYVAPVKPELEQPIKKRIQTALRDAGCAAWVHNIDNRQLHTGLDAKGCSDIVGIVTPHGRFLAIEVKRPKYSPSDVTADQRCFLAAVRKFGGVSGIATSVEQALALVEEARQPQRSDVT